MKNKLLILSKAALLLVVIGFFMPVCCNGNGFEIGLVLLKKDFELYDFFAGMSFLVLFFVAFLSVIIGIIRLIKHKEDFLCISWALLLLCIGCVIVIHHRLSRFTLLSLQYGAYVIVSGLIISLVLLLLASFCRTAKKEDKKAG